MMEPIILPRISDKKPLATVVSITYNHEPYIRDCLEGFLMQKTDFPIEIIIHDDASTDHTADIIREYYEKRPDLFHVIIEKENQYSQHKPIFKPLFEQAQGKYIALCEGDDYWTDPLKLQKQFNFMESNPELSGCFHNFITYYCDKGIFVVRNNMYHKKRILDIRNAIKNGAKDIHICTEFFKKSALENFETITKGCSVGDYPLQVCLASHGNLFYHDETMAVYRKNSQSSWTLKYKNSDNKTKIKNAKNSIKYHLRLRKVIKGCNKENAIMIGKDYFKIYYYSNKSIISYIRNKFIIEYIKNLSLQERIKHILMILTSEEQYERFKRILKKNILTP